MRVLFCSLVVMLYLGTAYYLYNNSKLRELRPSSTAVNWQINGETLSFISGEFRGFIASLLTLETGAYLGTEVVRKKDGSYAQIRKEYDWDYVERLVRLAMKLDPCFPQTYIVSQGHLPWQANKLESQNEILDLAIQCRFWDWQPIRTKAFNLYFFLNNYQDAGELLLQAAKKPDSPAFLPILGARFAQKSGRVENAITLIKSMLLTKDANDPDYGPLADRLEALQGVLIISQAVKEYIADLGSPPSSPQQLVHNGYLPMLPPNPYNTEYCIDTKGKVHFDNLNCLQKKF